MNRRRHVLIAILAVALVLRVLAWFAFPNSIWPDEIFQSLEQAHRVVFGFGVTPWEFRDGTRSWVLPGMLAGCMAATSLVTSSVTAYLATCATALSAISLAPVWAAFRATFDAFNLRAAVVASVVLVTWFELVYFAPKALNEVVAGNCLALGVVLADLAIRSPRLRTAIVAAVLLTLASMLRIQLAVAGFACFAYLFVKGPAYRWRIVIAAVIVVVALGLLDWATWRYPFQSYIENVRVNIVVGKSAQYGVAPWYAYFSVYARVWGIWGIAILALAGVGARVRPLLAVAALAVLATHVPIGHKEYRFAYPAMVMIVILAALGTAQVVEWIEQRTSRRTATLAAAGLIVVWIAASLQRADEFHESKTRLAVTFGPSQWHWVLHHGGLKAMEELGHDPTVCGIGMIGVNVFNTGGYAYLHRDVPLFETLAPEQIGGLARFVNVYLVLSSLATVDEFQGFKLDHCVTELCIYRRPGACEVMPDYSFNRVLRARGH